jgi:adenosylcobinamide-GDP ribazoletransferase
MVRSFLIAIQFLTRIPVPGASPREEEIARAAAFFPLVGSLIGGGGALVYFGLKQLLPLNVCILFVLVYSALVTNAYHEDGFADSLDGLGGGWTKEAALSIMRDSRIGTFGALGLILLVLTKYNLLALLPWNQLWRWLVFAHTASRWSALPLCRWLDYARDQGQAKSVAGKIGWSELLVGTLTLALCSLLLSRTQALAGFLVIAAVVILSGLYYRRRLQGITGDCLGATNQLVEVAVYLTAVVLMREA